MPEVLNNVAAWFATPIGQIALTVGGYLLAKRFPAFQSMVWFLLDALKVPRPNTPTPSPGPAPGPAPSPTPSPLPLPIVPGGPVDVGGIVSQLLAALLARRQHAAAADLIQLAQRLDEPQPAQGKGDA